MSEDNSDNPPAFACAAENGFQQGVTLLDYFAGQALGAIAIDCMEKGTAWKDTADLAYFIAAAMLKERMKYAKNN